MKPFWCLFLCFCYFFNIWQYCFCFFWLLLLFVVLCVVLFHFFSGLYTWFLLYSLVLLVLICIEILIRTPGWRATALWKLMGFNYRIKRQFRGSNMCTELCFKQEGKDSGGCLGCGGIFFFFLNSPWAEIWLSFSIIVHL